MISEKAKQRENRWQNFEKYHLIFDFQVCESNLETVGFPKLSLKFKWFKQNDFLKNWFQIFSKSKREYLLAVLNFGQNQE